jgi:hypothetical protein
MKQRDMLYEPGMLFFSPKGMWNELVISFNSVDKSIMVLAVMNGEMLTYFSHVNTSSTSLRYSWGDMQVFYYEEGAP